MVVPSSSSIFLPKSVSVAASRPSRARLPKGFVGSFMNRVPPRLCLWPFLHWHKIVLLLLGQVYLISEKDLALLKQPRTIA